MRTFTLGLLTCCLLCACGQKGNLYLPGSERQAVSADTAAPATPAASPLPAASPVPRASPLPTAAPAPVAAATGDTISAEERARQNAARTNPN